MEIAVQVLLSLVAGLLPEFGVASTSVISKIMTALETLVPNLIQNAPHLLAPIQNIIAALQSQGNLTPDQVTSLDSMEADTDAAFEAAATAAGFPDPTATPPATS